MLSVFKTNTVYLVLGGDKGVILYHTFNKIITNNKYYLVRILLSLNKATGNYMIYLAKCNISLKKLIQSDDTTKLQSYFGRTHICL